MTSKLYAMTKRQLQRALVGTRNDLKLCQERLNREIELHSGQRKMKDDLIEGNRKNTLRTIELEKEKAVLKEQNDTQEQTIGTLIKSNAALGEKLEKADGRVTDLLAITDSIAVTASRLAERL
jgi:hypothetical protein